MTSDIQSLTLPKWYDLHVHFRQGPSMRAYIDAHKAMGCASVLAMPNTKPPVAKVLESDGLPFWSIEAYMDMILNNGGEDFEEIIVPLYLTKDTTPRMVEDGVRSGLLRACKYYPPHGTTNADFGHAMSHYIDSGLLQSLQDNDVVLCIHGEQHGLEGNRYFDRDSNAEDIFYRETMPRVRDAYPDLKIVCEHITTETAVQFVQKSGNKTGATITPQHLLYTVGDLIKGLRYHLFCLPVVKFEKDRDALRAAVNDTGNMRFFAGTDSAPHTVKATECGCAAGCFTGGIAPQLYVQAFDLSQGQENFERFLCRNGPGFYGLPVSSETFTMTHTSQKLFPLSTPDGNVTPLPLGLGEEYIPWTIL